VTQNFRPGDIVMVDGRMATIVALEIDPDVGVIGATVGIWTDGVSEVISAGLHRISSAL